MRAYVCVCACVCVRASERACVCVCVRASERAYVCVRMHASVRSSNYLHLLLYLNKLFEFCGNIAGSIQLHLLIHSLVNK